MNREEVVLSLVEMKAECESLREDYKAWPDSEKYERWALALDEAISVLTEEEA